MKNGFMIGVVVGAAAFIAYDLGNKAKNTIENGKKAVKHKLDKFMD